MKIILTFLFTLFLITMLQSQTKNLPIVPAPQQVEFKDGRYTLNSGLTISIPSGNKELNSIAEEIQKTLNNFLKINSNIIEGKSGDINLSVTSEGALNKPNYSEEGYAISINENGISIKAPSAKGVFYGSMSLIQLLEKTKNNQLDFLEIVDWPDLKVRGISDDVSRGQVSTLENFKKIIRHIARYKMNTYMPYLEDMLIFKDHPLIGKDRGALTRKEIKEILSFAEKNYVEVIPIFQTLGHYENLLVLEEYIKYAEFPGAASLSVSNDSVYIFLEEMLKEVFEIFPSEYFHMGADESYDVGLGESKYLVDETDIATVHANHYKKVYDICKKYGKKVLMYGDIILQHPEILSQIPKDIIIVDWHYRTEIKYPSTKKFKDAGFDYYVSPSVWNFVTTFPTYMNSLPNITNMTKAGIEDGSLGMINSNWGDFGSETLKEFVLFGYAWSAQCAWSFGQSDLADFSRNYFYDFFGIDDLRNIQIYQTLSNPLNQMMWNEVWRHPLLPIREPAWWETRMSISGKLGWMDWTLPQTKNDINHLKNIALKNKDHYDLLNFMIELNNWFKIKVETQILLADSLKLSGDYQNAQSLVSENISSLKELKNNYRNFWLKYYKEDNLFMIEDKFDRMISYFSEIDQKLKNNEPLESPVLKSEWIYLPLIDSTFAREAEFKTDFILEGKPEEAYLQLMADTYAELFINDEFVERIYARRSLSLIVDYHRVKFIDIKDYLKEGENIITVKAKNYNRTGSAGINIIGQIKTSNKTEDILTDTLNWSGRADNEWVKVKQGKYPWTVIHPNFETKRRSWIER